MSQGLTNLDQIIEGCQSIADGIGELDGDPLGGDHLGGELQSVKQMEEQLEGLKDKFFMKTVAAVPATKVCLDSVGKMLQALEECRGGEGEEAISALKKEFTGFREAVELLLEKSQMRGTTLT